MTKSLILINMNLALSQLRRVNLCLLSPLTCKLVAVANELLLSVWKVFLFISSSVISLGITGSTCRFVKSHVILLMSPTCEHSQSETEDENWAL